MCFNCATLLDGRMQRSKPSLPASLTRASAWEMPRISPARPTSPKKTVFAPAARGDRRDDAEIDRGLVDVDAAGHVDENILIEKFSAHFLFQHGDQQRDAVVIDADRGASRHGQERPADERLQFD